MVTVLAFIGITGRIAYITQSGAYTVSDTFHSYKLIIDVNELQLYYSDMSKINNNVAALRAAVRPVPEEITRFNTLYQGSDKQTLMKELSRGYPVAIDVANADKASPLRVMRIYKTDTSLRQMISKSSKGLLYYAENPHDSEIALSVNYQVDAKGRLLVGDKGRVQDSAYLSRAGYVLSADSAVQQIVMNASKRLKSGCVVVMNPKNGKILACVSKPENTYLNKPLRQYSVGSVFKIIVAACALENHVDFHYDCKGRTQVGDITFSCQKERRHGKVTLKEALAQSCNCYFVHLALELGAKELPHTAEKFGFDSKISLFQGWSIDAAQLPDSSDLAAPASLALLGFGQGKLTATPLQICCALSTIANNGVYVPPVLVTGEKKANGNLTEYSMPLSKRVISEETANTLRKYLRYVVTDGTGYAAESSAKKSAGKTATAQTGQYENGRELYNTWFAGVYPYDNPKYCIVVMCEDGSSGAEDCCPIFRTIVENLDGV